MTPMPSILPPAPVPKDGPAGVTRRGWVTCPSCGWRESSDEQSCRSCGTGLAGLPVIREDAPAGPVRQVRTVLISEAVAASPPSGWARARLWPLVLAAVAAGLWWQTGRPVRYGPGMLVGEAPRQGGTGGKQPWQLKDGTTIIPLASYEINARLLHRERYRFDAMADISPVDFGVGWYRMSDQSVIDSLSFSNSNRFLCLNCRDAGGPEPDNSSAGNMHMLPANDRVKERLLDLRTGDLFFARGYLVSVERSGMNPWTSSLSREDMGNGACEIMWVEEISRKVPPQAR